MKLFLIIAFISICFISCQTESSYNKVIDVINDYSRIIKKEKGVVCSGYGLHYAGPDKIYDGKIHTIDLGYRVDKRMHYQDAKKLFYEIVDELLARLNEDKKVRKYFFHHPLTYEDLEFRLSFDYESKGFLKRDDVSSIRISENEITYVIAILDGAACKLVTTETSLGMGTLSCIGLDSTRRIVHKLPETEDK